MRHDHGVLGGRRGRWALLAAVGGTTAMTMAIGAAAGSARDAFSAGQRGTATLAMTAAEARLVTDRARVMGRALGIPDGVRQATVRLRDRFEGGVVDEVTTFDAADRPVAISRFAADGTLRTAVRLGWTAGTGDLTTTQARDRAAALVRVAGLAVAATPEIRRGSGTSGWSVAWPRTVDGVRVQGDGTWVRIWADGTLHSLARVESPLAARPTDPITADRAQTAARDQLRAWRIDPAAVTEVTQAWVSPNDLVDATRPDAVDGPRRLAWIVRVVPSTDTSDLRAIAAVRRCRRWAAARRRRARVTGYPPSRRPARPLPRRLTVVAAVLALLAGACASDPVPAFHGIVVTLTGPPGSGAIHVLDGAGVWSPVRLQTDGIGTLAVAPDGRLAATTLDGRLLVTDGEDEWRPVDLGTIPPAVEHDTFRIGWSADGRLAVVVAEAGDALISGIVVLDPDTSGGRWLGRALGLGGDPPAWLGPDRIVVPTRDVDDRPTATILDAATGEVIGVEPEVRAVSASADGATVATLGPDRRSVEVLDAAAWIARDEGGRRATFALAAEPEAVDALALSLDGDQLAAARSGGQASTVDVWTAAESWSLALSSSPLGAGDEVAWSALSLGFAP